MSEQPRAPIPVPPPDDPEAREPGHTTLADHGGRTPLLDRVMPRVAGGVAWSIVGLVVFILALLFVHGLPGLSWEFLSGDLSRGAFFTGGTLVEVTIERAEDAAAAAVAEAGEATAGAADASPSAPTAGPLLAFEVVAREGQVAIAGHVHFERNDAHPGVRWTAAPALDAPPDAAPRAPEDVRATTASASFRVGGAPASLAWRVPFTRDTSGGPHPITLDAAPLPAAVRAVSIQFMIDRPLRLHGLDAALVARGGADPGATPLRVVAPGWRLGPGEPVRLTHVAGSGVLPMIYGTFMVTLMMTVLCVPFGVLSAIYLHEYARRDALHTRIIRSAINNLAGVPSIVFGLFGLGFFIAFLGQGIDRVAFGGERVYGQACVLWAACTLAVLTLPVVIVATEEALRAIPQGLRDASLALGGTRWQTVWRIAVPEAIPGILTGMILAVGRGAGEVAPILFTGVTNFRTGYPSWSGEEKFMHLGYHVYALATQSPDVERTSGLLFSTVVVLLTMTFLLNLAAILLRLRLDGNRRRGAH